MYFMNENPRENVIHKDYLTKYFKNMIYISHPTNVFCLYKALKRLPSKEHTIMVEEVQCLQNPQGGFCTETLKNLFYLQKTLRSLHSLDGFFDQKPIVIKYETITTNLRYQINLAKPDGTICDHHINVLRFSKILVFLIFFDIP